MIEGSGQNENHKRIKRSNHKSRLNDKKTNWKGRYIVSSKDGLIIKTVRFSNAEYSKYDGKCINDATIKVLWYNHNNEECWYSMYIDGFLEDMKL